MLNQNKIKNKGVCRFTVNITYIYNIMNCSHLTDLFLFWQINTIIKLDTIFFFFQSQSFGDAKLLNCIHVCETYILNDSARAEVYLEEVSVIVHEKQHQSLALGSSQFMILDNCPLISATDQGPVINLKGNTRKSVIDSNILTTDPWLGYNTTNQSNDPQHTHALEQCSGRLELAWYCMILDN